MSWISKSQQERDHQGLRNVCAADGRDGTQADPLGLTDTGSRIHDRHFNDPGNGWFGRRQSN
jgi:hypothetical protein